MTTMVETASVELRREVQRRLQASGIEPHVAPDQVKILVRDVVGEYQTRARSGLGRVLADVDEVTARLERSLFGYGPLGPLLAPDSGIEEVYGVGNDVTFLDRRGRLRSLDEATDEEELRTVINRMLLETGRSVDAARPIGDAQVLDGRGRLSVSAPPVTDTFTWTLRLYTQSHETLQSLLVNGTISPPAAAFLAGCAAANLGALLSGPPGAGKTTFANAWLRAVAPTLRVIGCEETRELSVPLNNGYYMQTRPATSTGGDRMAEVNLRDLISHSLRQRPDLLVAGEVRGREAYELTRAGNAGTAVLATIHANSARDALQALVTTALMAGENVPVGVIRAVFSRTFQLLIHLDRHAQTLPGSDEQRVRHQVVEIAAVPPQDLDGSDWTVEPIFVRDGLDAPLIWTGVLPDDLRGRLDRVLRPTGVTTQDLLDGRQEVTL